MRRNLRPVPEADIVEFARVVEARVSDPDVEIPTPPPEAGAPETAAVEVEATESEFDPEATPRPLTPVGSKAGWAVDELDHLMREVDSVQGRGEAPSPPVKEPASWSRFAHPVPLHSRLPHRWHASVSSAQRTDPDADPGLPRYIRVLRELVQEGSWIGTLAEIARRTGDDTDRVFANLLKFHADLVSKDLVVAPVEVEQGWQWLVVDRSRIRPTAAAASSLDEVF
jgi:hypothetical protein